MYNLQVFKQFPGTSDSFHIHLVEVSHAMRLAQQEHLRGSGKGGWATLNRGILTT